GLIASLARPSGNVTGVSATAAELGGKLVELIRELRPAATRVAVLLHSTDPFAKPFLNQIQSAADTLRVRVQPVVVRGTEEFAGVFAALAQKQPDAVVVQPIFATRRVADLALKHRLASITTGSQAAAFPQLGGLLAYGPKESELYRRAAWYVDKVL